MQGNGRKVGQGGFTLIELLVVVAIIAVLAAFLLPSYLGAVEEGKLARVQSDVAVIARQTAISLSQKALPDGSTRTLSQDDLELNGKLDTTLVRYGAGTTTGTLVTVNPVVQGGPDDGVRTATLTLTLAGANVDLRDKLVTRLTAQYPNVAPGTGAGDITVTIFRSKKAIIQSTP